MRLDAEQWKLDAVEDEDEELFWPRSPTPYEHAVVNLRRSFSRRQPVVRSPGLVGRYSPVSLRDLTLQAFLDQLKGLCSQRNYGENKRGLKHYLKFLLPAPLRQQLLDLAMKDGRIYTLFDLNIFELLLSPIVKRVDNIHSVRPFFRQPFAAMLRQLGNGLHHLSIEDNSWLQGRESLPAALARMTCLRRVSLRYLANDWMVAALAKNCLHLQEMDVSNSCGVTDAGIKVLCNPETSLQLPEETDDDDEGDGKQKGSSRRRKISAPAGCLVWLPRMVRGAIRRHSVVDQQQASRNQSVTSLYADDENASLLWPEDQIDDHLEGKLQCIRSLRHLDVQGTSVSPYGIQLILSSSPNISIVS